jgi:hypothetical protein
MNRSPSIEYENFGSGPTNGLNDTFLEGSPFFSPPHEGVDKSPELLEEEFNGGGYS